MEIEVISDGPRRCKRCGSEKPIRYKTEVCVHQPPLGAPHVFVFPEIVLCPGCGFTGFEISAEELSTLRDKVGIGLDRNWPPST